MKALEKFAFSVTRAGHELDEKEYGSHRKRVEEHLENMKNYGKKNPTIGQVLGNGPANRFNLEVMRNRSAHIQNKHKRKKNSYNPFAGWSDASYEKNMKRLSAKK